MHGVTRDEAVRRAFEADASGLYLCPDAVARPTSEEQVVELLREAAATRTAVTPAGGQTSTTGASITDVGTLLSLRSLDRIVDIDPQRRIMRVQAGALVADVKRAAAAEGLLFAPDPTSEEECTIGGAIACNASGARTLEYGPTRAHVRALRVALADGSVIDCRRTGIEKNTVGYALAQEPVDWFVGSEGTLGVVLEAELALLPRPEQVLGLAFPFTGEVAALAFVVAAREARTVHPRCLEFFDAGALSLARSADGATDWAANAGALVYVEQELGGSREEELDPVLDAWLRLADEAGAQDDVRVYRSEAELRAARQMRHAVPAAMNDQGARCRAAGGRKVSTDWSVQYRRLAEAIAAARRIADDHGVPPAALYGHAGNGHPHENFIAPDADALERVNRAVEATLRHVLSMGGTVASEHGIGKLKRRWLPLQLSSLQIGVMRSVKRELDPLGILAPGNVL